MMRLQTISRREFLIDSLIIAGGAAAACTGIKPERTVTPTTTPEPTRTPTLEPVLHLESVETDIPGLLIDSYAFKYDLKAGKQGFDNKKLLNWRDIFTLSGAIGSEPETGKVVYPVWTKDVEGDYSKFALIFEDIRNETKTIIRDNEFVPFEINNIKLSEAGGKLILSFPNDDQRSDYGLFEPEDKGTGKVKRGGYFLINMEDWKVQYRFFQQPRFFNEDWSLVYTVPEDKGVDHLHNTITGVESGILWPEFSFYSSDHGARVDVEPLFDLTASPNLHFIANRLGYQLELGHVIWGSVIQTPGDQFIIKGLILDKIDNDGTIHSNSLPFVIEFKDGVYELDESKLSKFEEPGRVSIHKLPGFHKLEALEDQ